MSDLVQVRLAGDDRLPNSGRLEVRYNATWGTVCDDWFHDEDAHVACTTLGFRYFQGRSYTLRYEQAVASLFMHCHLTNSAQTLYTWNYREIEKERKNGKVKVRDVQQKFLGNSVAVV